MAVSEHSPLGSELNVIVTPCRMCNAQQQRMHWRHDTLPCCKCFMSRQKVQSTAFARGVQCQSTADKLDCSDQGPVPSPDISMLSIELQQQWHVDESMHLGPIKVKHHTVTSRLCGNATSTQLGSHMSGQPVLLTEGKAHSAHTAATSWCACTSLRLLWPLKWLSTGITARMRKHQIRHWLAASAGLSGSAHVACGNGKHLMRILSAQTLIAPNAVGR